MKFQWACIIANIIISAVMATTASGFVALLRGMLFRALPGAVVIYTFFASFVLLVIIIGINQRSAQISEQKGE